MGAYEIGSDVWPGSAKLIEECGELVQVLAKLIAMGGGTKHYDGLTPLDQRIVDEAADVEAAIHFLLDHNKLDAKRFFNRVTEKEDLFRTWHNEHLKASGSADPESDEERGFRTQSRPI